MPHEPPPPSAKELAWVAGNALLAVLVAGSQLNLSGEGGRDEAVVRGVGLGSTGGYRALDGWLSAGFASLPVGTRMLRAELPGVLLLALVAVLTFVVARRALVAVAGPSVWTGFVATVATATLSCAYPFVHEAVSPSSGLLGVALVLAALAGGTRKGEADWPVLAALLILGVTYEPAVGACIAAAVAADAWVARTGRKLDADATNEGGSALELFVSVAVAVVLGTVPLALALIHGKVSALSTSARPFASAAGASVALGGSGMHHAFTFVNAELGEVMLLLAAGGGVYSLLTVRGRRETLPLAAVTLVATVVVVSGGGGVREAWTPTGLVALGGYVVFAAVAMQEAVVRVARARLPLAAGSAAMVVLLEAAFPAIMLDDGLSRAGTRSPLALPTWEDTAWSGLPSGTLLLVGSARLYARLLATRASGTLPGDLTLLPIFDPKNEASASALAHNERLVPLFRDLALTGLPQELSLSTLAAVRPLALATDPHWDRSLTRHLLPEGLLALFEPEPRGGADRKHALETSAPARARLAKALPSAAEAPLAQLTLAILLDRAIAAVQTGEKEVAIQALTDTTLFSPGDTRVAKLVFKEATAHGPVDAHELAADGLSEATLK